MKSIKALLLFSTLVPNFAFAGPDKKGEPIIRFQRFLTADPAPRSTPQFCDDVSARDQLSDLRGLSIKLDKDLLMTSDKIVRDSSSGLISVEGVHSPRGLLILRPDVPLLRPKDQLKIKARTIEINKTVFADGKDRSTSKIEKDAFLCAELNDATIAAVCAKNVSADDLTNGIIEALKEGKPLTFESLTKAIGKYLGVTIEAAESECDPPKVIEGARKRKEGKEKFGRITPAKSESKAESAI